MKAQFILFALAATAIAAPQRNRNGANGGNAASVTSAAAGTAPSGAAGGNNNGGAISPSLIPDPGIQAGTPNPASNGADCLGNNNVAIPCKCPPSQQDLISKMQLFNQQGNAQGTPFNFPTDTSDQSQATQKTRINMIIIALQNFDNTSPGVGCPAAAAAPNYVRLQREL